MFRVLYGNGSEGFLKPFGARDVHGVSTWYANVGACGLHGHHPTETILNEASAWQLAKRLGGPVAEVATPAVLRTFPAHGVAGVVSARRYGIARNTRAVGRAPGQALAAAFFDSLIAQQDRHPGNFRWHEPPWMLRLPRVPAASLRRVVRAEAGKPLGLGLIDHGFCFARPGDFVRPDRRSLFLDWRHAHGRETLSAWEHQALDDLLSDPTLYGLRDFLEHDRAQALADRAELMRRRGAVLDPGEW